MSFVDPPCRSSHIPSDSLLFVLFNHPTRPERSQLHRMHCLLPSIRPSMSFSILLFRCFQYVASEFQEDYTSRRTNQIMTFLSFFHSFQISSLFGHYYLFSLLPLASFSPFLFRFLCNIFSIYLHFSPCISVVLSSSILLAFAFLHCTYTFRIGHCWRPVVF